jgi:hypothetical protein
MPGLAPVAVENAGEGVKRMRLAVELRALPKRIGDHGGA